MKRGEIKDEDRDRPAAGAIIKMRGKQVNIQHLCLRGDFY